LFSEMRSVQRTFPSLSPREILELVTVNPARALHQAGNLGQIKKDALADLIALPCATASAAIFDAILAHEEPIRWVMIDGAVVIS
jgi:imidazolonepropionase-like amidohydrolase